MKRLFYILALMVMASSVCYAADQSCGCAAGLGDGVANNPSRGYTQCFLIETVDGGTLDSMVFSARDFNCGGGYGADTLYGAVYTMDVDSNPQDVVAISQDRVEVTGTSEVDWMVEFNSEAISATTAYHLCVTVRGDDDCTRIEVCNDDPGYGSLPGASGVDVWPLEDPSELVYDNTSYAPDALVWYTTENGAPVSIGGRRRKILQEQ